MSDEKKEPTRPAPSSGRTSGMNWADIASDKEFSEKDKALRDAIRSRGDFL
jgi:hypothetical protein